MKKRDEFGVKCVILLAFIMLVFFIFTFGMFLKGYHSWDVSAQQKWGNIAFEKGLSTLYSEGQYLDYPPAYTYILKLNSYLSQKIFLDNQPLLDGYVIISKTLPTIAILLTGLLIFFFIKKRKGMKKALVGSALYIFNLGLIYNAAYWGQVDAVLALMVFASILFLIKERYLLSVLAITLAFLTKVQSVVLAPIIGIVILLKTKVNIWLKSFGVAVLTFFLIFLPTILGGNFTEAFYKSFRQIDFYPKVTVNAFNSWFLVSPTVPNWRDTIWDGFGILGFSFKTIGLTLLAIYLLFVLYGVYKKPNTETIILACASITFAFFMLPTQIHERHLFPFFVFLLTYYLLTNKFLWTYIIVSTNYLINMIVLLGAKSGTYLFYEINWLIENLTRVITLNQLGMVISIINLVLFINFSIKGIFNGLKKELEKDGGKFIEWLKK